MKLPNPRGFVQSGIFGCDGSIGLFTPERKASMRKPSPVLDLDDDSEAILPPTFRRSSFIPAKIPSLRKDEIFGTFAAAREDADLMLSYSPPRFRVRKDGVRKELKFKVQISTVTVTVQCRGASFYFRASNRGHLIFDSRDESRKLPCAVRPELLRLLGTSAAAAERDLVAVIEPPREKKAKPLPAGWVPIERTPDAPRPARKRPEKTAMEFSLPAKAEKPRTDFSAMSARQLAAFHAKASAASAADMLAMLNSNVDESAAPLPAPVAPIFPAPFVEIEIPA